MTEPKVLVLRAAGVNCDEETAWAFERAGATTKRIHVNRLFERPTDIDAFDAVVVPGGFSYGDDISAGKLLAIEIGRTLGERLRALLDRGGLVLGICNGFQVLIKSGLLPGPEATPATEAIQATLVTNDRNRYEDRWVRLAVDSAVCKFVTDDEPIELPVAHAEGRFVAASADDIERLEANHRVVVRYTTDEGGKAPYPANPNGSMAGIAGICDASGQVFGLMPHPERFLEPWQHPCQTRRRGNGKTVGDGQRLFDNAVQFLKKN